MSYTTEKRRHTRIQFDADALLCCANHRYQTVLIDISLNGALLEAPRNWPRRYGADCSLELELSQGEILIRMEGAVVTSDEEFVRFRCDHIELDSISYLRHLVELNLGDDALLERELFNLVNE